MQVNIQTEVTIGLTLSLADATRLKILVQNSEEDEDSSMKDFKFKIFHAIPSFPELRMLAASESREAK